ncbi:uncharacterized protein [Physcomitrium patens]|uniref:Uncharacterized protein n=1 Tax=Physcomitrium patens TaxID=3218 RepID=A0A2K1L915_PHYPA|nr:uncharacterized protein LOC112289163 [Physcomitrium patens]PNR62526.1 hypothetical protein PHYPA_000950 [Physcomitrium patens]|eukprot:XP_024389898.1 uncharacterized protein LOC112289163 [Physcomitrella patens]
MCITHGELTTSNMSKPAILWCIFAVLWSVASAYLVPPPGYSVGFTGRITAGSQRYICNRGSWIKIGAFASILTPDGHQLGSYTSKCDSLKRTSTYAWKLLNSPGTTTESGHSSSGLQGIAVMTVQVSTSAVSEYLAIVKKRIGGGDASLVVFVSLTGTKGGLPPRKALCTSNGATSGVPFQGTFTFFTQDQVPPRVPASLKPLANFVQVFFLEGMMQYRFDNNGRWTSQGHYSTIYDVAGGTSLGKFGTVRQSDRFGSNLMFKLINPNGFWFYAEQCAKPVRVSLMGAPWQLLQITSSGGYKNPMGTYRFALIASVMGGQPPKLAARAYGMTYGAAFSAQCYLYV